MRLVRALAQQQWLLWTLVALFVLSSVLSSRADDHIRKVSSGHWHKHQPRLRQALKDAREVQPL